MLSLYRAAIRVRATEAGFGDGPLAWLPETPGVLGFARPGGLLCLVNLGPESAALPAHESVLLASGPLDEGGLLPTDTAVWLRR